MKVPTKWTNHLDKSEKEEFESKLLEQKYLFSRLRDLVDIMEQSNYKERLAKSNYESPSWAESQADAIGYARALTDIQFLLKFTKE